MNVWIVLGALMLAAAVGAGAFGAHGLRATLDAYSMAIYEKAVFYHFVHSLGLLLVVLLAASNQISNVAAHRVLLLLIIGTVIFSGSLYLLAVTGARWLGAITPIGGTLFIAAWLLLAWSAYRSSSE